MYRAYLSILNSELIPAMGCTEPIVIALAAAIAKKHLVGSVVSAEAAVRGIYSITAVI